MNLSQSRNNCHTKQDKTALVEFGHGKCGKYPSERLCVCAAWKEILFQEGGIKNKQESQGHLEAKVTKQRVIPSSILRCGFFFFSPPSTYRFGCQKQN